MARNGYDLHAVPLDTQLGDRLERLLAAGVNIVDPRQTFIGADVDLQRIEPGVTLFPGTRVSGRRTFLARGAQLGSEGPVSIDDGVVGPDSTIGSGLIQRSVLLGRATLSGNVHIRPGCLLEEQVSVGHSVGLKQTLLLSFVTLGSLINFCDVLMAGGRSRQEHSEVGSGFIHFNFAPRGKHGHKATATLVGDVVDGVMLDQPRIFLGGLSGAVGPLAIGFGSVTAAGQVLREDVASDRLVHRVVQKESNKPVDGRISSERLDQLWTRNATYIAQLWALRAWYQHVRRPRAAAQRHSAIVAVDEGIHTIDYCLDERVKQLRGVLEEHGSPALSFGALPPVSAVESCPIDLERALDIEHPSWVQSLEPQEKKRVREWLHSVMVSARASIDGGKSAAV
jgi:hypothetical protein